MLKAQLDICIISAGIWFPSTFQMGSVWSLELLGILHKIGTQPGKAFFTSKWCCLLCYGKPRILHLWSCQGGHGRENKKSGEMTQLHKINSNGMSHYQFSECLNIIAKWVKTQSSAKNYNPDSVLFSPSVWCAIVNANLCSCKMHADQWILWQTRYCSMYIQIQKRSFPLFRKKNALHSHLFTHSYLTWSLSSIILNNKQLRRGEKWLLVLASYFYRIYLDNKF